MTAYVFAGPTLDDGIGRSHLDAVFLPPVEQGDVYRLTLRAPSAIGIVDGRFQDVPAVWHKEILWAMTQGVPVYGAASMGALRAAELAAFGMRGIGWIFEQFHSGAIVDDDEVTVGHGGADEGYAARCEAMVNIRRTVEAATSDGVIAGHTGHTLVQLIKSRFYTERSYPLMLQLGRRAGLPEAELAHLAAWLPTNRVDQKRRDAIEMLDVMAADLATGDSAPRADFAFQHTDFFEQTRLTAGSVGTEPDAGETALDEVLTELRLDAESYRQTHDRALIRALAVRLTWNSGISPDEQQLHAAAERFRRERRLYSAAETRHWLDENHLNLDQFTALIREQIAIARALGQGSDEFGAYLRSQARVDGVYPELVKRMAAKTQILHEAGLDDRTTEIGNERYDDLVRWHFGQRGETPPADLETHWRSLGYLDEIAFRRALQRECWFQAARTAKATTTEPRMSAPEGGT